MRSYDYIVIGAGSAGCVVATRLVQAGKRVLLLEAGPTDNSPIVHIPGALLKLSGTERHWGYESEPEPSAFGRRIAIPQGRTLGGGSSVNGMIYVRGQAEDYDSWAAAGCVGWAYSDVLPAFKRSEDNLTFSDAFHGVGGPLKVSDAAYRHPLSYAFLRACQETGLAYTPDFNGSRQDGVGFFQTTSANGRRQSTAVAFLSKVRGNSLLTVRTDAHVEGVVIENGAATGVKWRERDGAAQTAQAREEVILSAGALATPKLLQLSGIGPGALLAEHGIDVKQDRQQVGQNFQDHWHALAMAVGKDGMTWGPEAIGLRAMRHGLEYALFRRGILTSNVLEAGGFVDTTESGRPDVQLHLLPALVVGPDGGPPPLKGFGVSACVLRPKARGQVRIRSGNAVDNVWFEAKPLGHPDDVATMVRGLRLARRILHAPSLAAVVESEIAPGKNADDVLSDEVIGNYGRGALNTVYHPCGTCRMGSDADAVVDVKLRVNGVRRLRVADASIMPSLISGNTNAPSIMIGERCAEFVLGHAV